MNPAIKCVGKKYRYYQVNILPMDNMRFLNVSIEVSAAPCSGACITMIIAPKTHCKHPTLPWNDSLSFKKMEDNTALF